MKTGQRVIEVSRRIFPLTAATSGFLAVFLAFGYVVAQSDYGSVCLGPPIYPRCVSDLYVMVQIEAVGVACTVLMASGVLLNQARKGALQLMTAIVFLVLVVYVSHWFV